MNALVSSLHTNPILPFVTYFNIIIKDYMFGVVDYRHFLLRVPEAYEFGIK